MKSPKGFVNLALVTAVIVFVALLGVWWFIYQSPSSPTAETTQLPTEQTTQHNTNNETQPVVSNQGHTYTNSQYGFSVQYPSDATFSLSNPGRFLNGSVSFSVGKNDGSSTYGRLDMGFPSSPEYCAVPKTDASHTAPTDLHYQTMGGISFATYSGTSLAPSANYIEKIYQGLRGNDCYFFVETITSASMAERIQMEAKLDAIVQTFHFGN